MVDELFTATDEKNDTKDSLYGLLKSNAAPTLLSDALPNDAPTDKQMCPWCESDVWMSQEEFELHLAVSHPEKVDESLTQTVMAAFANPDLLRAIPDGGKKKKKRRLSESGSVSEKRKRKKTEKAGASKAEWSCSVCTFANTRVSRKCKMCQTPKV